MEQTKNWYDKYYKLTIIIPAVFLLFSLIYLFNFNIKNGDLIYRDITITGGTTITILDKNLDIDKLKIDLGTEFEDMSIRRLSDLGTGDQKGIIIETKAEADIIKEKLEEYLGYALTQDNSSVEFSGQALSSGFYQQLRLAIVIAFILMALVVFFVFKTFLPSFAVILSAFADIVMTIAVVDLLGMQLSIAGIVAFLMLIGYSVDTDILLTSRSLKNDYGTLNLRLYEAFKTGITMTLTAIVAVGVSLIVIYGYSEVLEQIFTILLIGLGFDIINTWLTNAPLLKWYIEAKIK